MLLYYSYIYRAICSTSKLGCSSSICYSGWGHVYQLCSVPTRKGIESISFAARRMRARRISCGCTFRNLRGIRNNMEQVMQSFNTMEVVSLVKKGFLDIVHLVALLKNARWSSPELARWAGGWADGQWTLLTGACAALLLLVVLLACSRSRPKKRSGE